MSFQARRRVGRALWRVMPILQYLRYQQPNPIEPWDRDGEFQPLLASIQDHTLVDKVRCYVLYQTLQQCLTLDGTIAEVGVYRGGTARLLATLGGRARKRVHLFDTFGGMPETDEGKDWHAAGDFSDTSLDAVKTFLDGLDVAFHPGVFPQTAAGLQSESFCFVHVDADIHRSVWDSCEFFYSRLVAGGVFVFDDYGFVTCDGAKQAVDTFFADRAEVPCYLPTGQCLVTKLPTRSRGGR